jgi:hypothetical protein
MADGTPVLDRTPRVDGTPILGGTPTVDGESTPDASPAPADAGEVLANELLFGSTFTHGMTMTLDGSHGLVFAFTDLSVRAAGTYFLRYRCFDIFTSGADDPGAHPLLARATSATFRIHSAKHFPGFAPSTKLTRVRALHAQLGIVLSICADPGHNGRASPKPVRKAWTGLGRRRGCGRGRGRLAGGSLHKKMYGMSLDTTPTREYMFYFVLLYSFTRPSPRCAPPRPPRYRT